MVLVDGFARIILGVVAVPLTRDVVLGENSEGGRLKLRGMGVGSGSGMGGLNGSRFDGEPGGIWGGKSVMGKGMG